MLLVILMFGSILLNSSIKRSIAAVYEKVLSHLISISPSASVIHGCSFHLTSGFPALELVAGPASEELIDVGSPDSCDAGSTSP